MFLYQKSKMYFTILIVHITDIKHRFIHQNGRSYKIMGRFYNYLCLYMAQSIIYRFDISVQNIYVTNSQ